jgi:hypothetical protein
MHIQLGHYANGQPLVQLWDEDGPACTLSTAIEDAPKLPDDGFWLKDWSENRQRAGQMIEDGLIEPIPDIAPAPTGFVTSAAYRLTAAGQELIKRPRTKPTHFSSSATS